MKLYSVFILFFNTTNPQKIDGNFLLQLNDRVKLLLVLL